MDVSVILATCGDRSWIDLAAGRALPSVGAQSLQPAEVIAIHRPTAGIHEARNQGAERARSEWLCFLDADDELHPEYLATMASAGGDLRAPAVQFIRDGVAAAPVVLANRDIDTMNPCVIGTLVRRELFLDAGGFWSWPAWEDWCLWRRCWLLGAALVHVPEAVYRAYVTAGGRNSAHTDNRQLHRRITARHRRWQLERAA